MDQIYNIWVDDLNLFEGMIEKIPKNIKIISIEELKNENIEEKVIDALILSIWPEDDILDELSLLVEPYRTFYDSSLLLINNQVNNFVRRTCAQPYQSVDIIDVINKLSIVLPVKPYGVRYKIDSIEIMPEFKNSTQYHGQDKIEIKSKYSGEYRQLLTWKKTIVFKKGQPLELWLEHTHDTKVELMLKVLHIESGTVNKILSVKTYSQRDIENSIIINEIGNENYLSISLYIKGEGSISIGNLHVRNSNLGFGQFVFGGQRALTLKNEEFMYYFHPGNLKPPFTVYFSGYRTLEGFEGYSLMKDLGTPFLLVSDPRLEGGAFYIGDDEYESMIVDTVNTYLDYLGFNNKDLILSGLSMGTYGALYYGTLLSPHSVVIGKPLINLGTMAENEELLRPHEFPTSLDLLIKNEGSLTKKAAKKFNNKYWDSFVKQKLMDTNYYIAYMLNDDYDATAYSDLLNYLPNNRIKIVGKGFTGRHNDNTTSIVNWFFIQLKSVVKEIDGRNTNHNE